MVDFEGHRMEAATEVELVLDIVFLVRCLQIIPYVIGRGTFDDHGSHDSKGFGSEVAHDIGPGFLVILVPSCYDCC